MGGYKGIEYALTDLGNDRWGWVFYPKKEEGPAHRGEVLGTREHAEMACMRAINLWLGQDAVSGQQQSYEANPSRRLGDSLDGHLDVRSWPILLQKSVEVGVEW